MAVSRTQHTFLRSEQAVRSGGAGCLPGLCTRGSSRGRPDCMEGGEASLTHPTFHMSSSINIQHTVHVNTSHNVSRLPHLSDSPVLISVARVGGHSTGARLPSPCEPRAVRPELGPLFLAANVTVNEKRDHSAQNVHSSYKRL